MTEVTVLDPGALATVQDRGRPGWAHLGVPRSGAADLHSHDLANRLVGNPPEAAGLEVTLTGCRFRCTGATRLAVTGAVCAVHVGGRAEAWGRALVAPAGAEVVIGPAISGLRSYVAVAGGLQVEPVLGSRSTDLLSGLGPAPLAAGTVLPVGEAPGPAPWVELSRPVPGPIEVEVVPGPRADWFASLAELAGDWTVGAASNRIGVRLEGPPLARLADREGTELESEAMVLGAVQVPPSGQPVVLLADHATTGGYPVIAVVREVSGIAQARPGEQVTLRLAR